MKLLLIGLTFILLAQASYSCTISASDVTLTTQKNKLKSFDIKNCSQSQIEQFNELLNSSNGSISSSYLNMLEGLQNITLTPKHIRLRSLESIVHTRLNLKENQKIEFLDNTISKDFLKLSEDEFLEANCTNCKKRGIKNILLRKSNGTKTQKIWAKAKILTAIETLVSSKNIGVNFSGLEQTDFTKKTVYVEEPSDYIGVNNNVSYYRANQSISQNQALKRSLLSPLQLVKYGTPTKVNLKRGNLNMVINAYPLMNGHFGEIIKLKNNKSKKIFTGKIIGINEVRVEL